MARATAHHHRDDVWPAGQRHQGCQPDVDFNKLKQGDAIIVPKSPFSPLTPHLGPIPTPFATVRVSLPVLSKPEGTHADEPDERRAGYVIIHSGRGVAPG